MSEENWAVGSTEYFRLYLMIGFILQNYEYLDTMNYNVISFFVFFAFSMSLFTFRICNLLVQLLKKLTMLVISKKWNRNHAAPKITNK